MLLIPVLIPLLHAISGKSPTNPEFRSHTGQPLHAGHPPAGPTTGTACDGCPLHFSAPVQTFISVDGVAYLQFLHTFSPSFSIFYPHNRTFYPHKTTFYPHNTSSCLEDESLMERIAWISLLSSWLSSSSSSLSSLLRPLLLELFLPFLWFPL